jgi:O-antigen biosynthesis protein
MENKLSVVIPCYNNWNLTHSLLYDLYNFNKDGLNDVVIVDDCSTDRMVKDGLLWWMEQKMLPINLIHLNKNVGFLKASNIGVEKSIGDDVLLISNDVSIKRTIVNEVREKLKSGKCIVGARLIDWDSGWNHFKGVIAGYLEGYLLGFTKDVWKDLGGFDEIYCPHIFEDVDLSYTATRKGYSLVQLDNTAIIHKVAGTISYTPERDALTKENREKFRKKWNLEYE